MICLFDWITLTETHLKNNILNSEKHLKIWTSIKVIERNTHVERSRYMYANSKLHSKLIYKYSNTVCVFSNEMHNWWYYILYCKVLLYKPSINTCNVNKFKDEVTYFIKKKISLKIIYFFIGYISDIIFYTVFSILFSVVLCEFKFLWAAETIIKKYYRRL